MKNINVLLSVGADIAEMSKKSFFEVLDKDFPDFGAFSRCRKPIVAAVNGHAVCDVFFAVVYFVVFISNVLCRIENKVRNMNNIAISWVSSCACD